MKSRFNTFYFCILFVFTFGAIGAGAWYVIGATIYDGMRAKEWVRVRAELVSFGQGSVSYNYRFGEKQYHGDRLGSNVIGGTDNIDSWHDDINEHLNDARAGTKPLLVWVNPDNPAESMVDREIRWKFLVFASVFGFAFGGVGVAALVVGIYDLIPKRLKQLRRKRSDAAMNVGGLWFFAFLWNAISFPIAFLAVPQMLNEGEWMGLLILVFPLVGLMVLWGAIHATWGLIRRGGATLVLSDDAPQPGKPLSGHITFAKGVKTGQNFRVRLEAQRVTQDGEDTSVRSVWNKEIQARVADSGGGPRIAFRFDPPANVRADTWRVEAIAPERGAEVKYGFNVAMQPAAEADLSPAVAAFDDEPMPVALGPGFENVEQMLNGAGVKLTRDQQSKFTAMTAEERANVARLLKWAPLAKKVAIAVFIAFVVFQVLGFFAALLSN